VVVVDITVVVVVVLERLGLCVVVVDIIVVVVVVLERLGLCGLGLCGIFLLTDDLNTVPIVFPIEEAKFAAEFPND